MANRAWRPGAGGERDADADETRFRLRRGAKALVTSSDAVLLVRERHADGTPFWTLPGGGVRPGERLPAALRRELAEELRCRCLPGTPLTSFWYVHSTLRRTATRYRVFDCRVLSQPSPVAAEGVGDVRWARPDSLPTRTLPQVVHVVERAVDP